MEAMLEDQRRDLGQLPLLVGEGRSEARLGAVEAVSARTPGGQVIEAPIDPLGRGQLTGLAVVAGLAARLSRGAPQLLAGRARRSARVRGGSQDGGIELL